MRPEKDLTHPPGQVVNPLTPTPRLSAAAIADARPLLHRLSKAPKQAVEELMRAWREEGRPVRYDDLVELHQLFTKGT